MKEIGYIMLLLLLPLAVFSQEQKAGTKIEIGVEFQAYPVGYIPVVTSNVFFKEDLAVRLRVGGNFADRRDKSGFNDDEVAKGAGFSVGILKYFPVKKGHLIAGFTTDFWFMKTKWVDNNEKGTTKNVVIQPCISGGYLFDFSKKFNAGLTLGFGREINTFNRGEEVGQGFMGSIAIQANYKLN